MTKITWDPHYNIRHKYIIDWSLKDGNLNQNTGRLVVYKQYSMISKGPSMDHNDLLRALASSINIKLKDDIISNAYRFYYEKMSYKKEIIISPVRRIDLEFIEKDKKSFFLILLSHFEKIINWS
jgi:hypothetical protein